MRSHMAPQRWKGKGSGDLPTDPLITMTADPSEIAAPENGGVTEGNLKRVDLGGEEELTMVNEDEPEAKEDPPTGEEETGDASSLDVAGSREERLTREAEAEADDLQA